MNDSKKSIAVLIPCRNEETTVADVVKDFSDALPESIIYVYDNASEDQTTEKALEAGARVFYEPLLGKGHVVRRMFSDVEADIYVMADGDGTYEPSEAPFMIKKLLTENLDMVAGSRINVSEATTRRGHTLGNRIFNTLYRFLFGSGFSDIFTGYRVLSRRLVKSFPALSVGFEIETELAVHTSQLQLPVSEIPVSYKERPKGSNSKLRTFPDGFRILRSMIALLKDNRPFFMFGSLAMLSFLVAAVLSIPILLTYFDTGLVPRLPTVILSASLVLFSLLLLALGLILDSISKSRIEAKRVAYMQNFPLR